MLNELPVLAIAFVTVNISYGAPARHPGRSIILV
ncbi:hypothetical protein FB556_1979 [Enteractinococcus coprophilus]|uniref:Uncharacterized protein n=1 Tax=Enteractinococcus coprophilus TaxID=1027633 RepID=A0A543AFX5_9MICC|nr:hypothetical protein FB556_1979 [Enteractinococcus coprophilus]